VRRVDFADWQERRKSFLRIRARLGAVKSAASRPRDPEERDLLLRLDQVRWKKWLASGRLARLGPRHYRLDPKLGA